MALQKRVVPVLLRGLDQRGPRQTAITGEIENLRNMVIVKGNAGGYELVPRPGESAVSKTADIGVISTGMRLGVLGTALVLLTGTNCYRKAIDGWHLVDATAPVMGVTTDAIAADGVQAQSTDTAYVNGFTVSAVVQGTASLTSGSIIAVAKDSTGATVVKTTLQSGTGVKNVRIAVSGTVAVIFWRVAPNTIRAAKFDSAAPSAFTAPQNITTVASDNIPLIDVQTIPSTGQMAIVFNHMTAEQLSQRLLTPSTMTLGGIVNYAINDSYAMGFLTNTFSTNVIYLATLEPGGLRVTTFDGTTIAQTGTSIYDASITSSIGLNVAGYRNGAAVSVYVSVVNGTNSYDYQIRLSTGGVATNVRRGLALASHVLSANGTLYALARYEVGASNPVVSMKSTFFLMDLVAQREIAKVYEDAGGSGLNILSNMPNLAVAATANTWLTAATKVVAFASENSEIVPYTAASAVTFTFQDATVGRPVELNGVLFIPGAMPYIYDGTTLTEAGFPISPEVSPNVSPGVGGGQMSAGHTYSYAYVFAWTDAIGNIYRSAPTIEFQVVMGVGDDQVNHSIPTLRSTRKAGVVIETYRRNLTANEVILRRVSSATVPTFNDPTADRVTFVDQVSDVTAASGEPIYTEGAVLENIAPPPCRTMAVHRGRLLVGGIAGDPAAIWTSKDVIPGFGVAFSDALVSRLSTAEAITALGSVDSYAVACTGVGAGSTWASSNDYPDDTGGGGVLRFEHMSGSVGCSSPMLMARDDDGLHVWAGTKGSTQSGLKGPYLITRGMSFEQVGAATEDDADILTPAAVLAVPTRNQVRFLGSSSDVAAAVGVALVRESFFKTWSRWDYARHSAAIVDATVWQGAATYLATDGTVYTETLTDTVIDDLGFAVPHSLDIAAFNFGGVAGYSRIRLGQLTGTVKGAAAVFTLSVVQTADGTAMAAKTRVITGQADGSALDVEFDPGPNGKCSAYALRISDSGNSANAAFTLAAITMEVGTKPGLNRLVPARRMT